MRGEPFKEAWKTWETIRCEVDGLFHGRRDDSKPRSRGFPMLDQSPRSMPRVTIRELMTLDPITLRPEMPLHRALALLVQNDLSAAPVVSEDGVIVGLLNERHLLTALGDPEAMTVFAVMDPEPMIVEADDPVVEVVDRLMSINVRQVLVFDGGALVGVVTRADLMPAVLEEFRARARRMPGFPVVAH